MPQPSSPHATVLRRVYGHGTVPDVVAVGDKIYAAGSTAAEVAASPVATAALAHVKEATDGLRVAFAARVALALALQAAIATEKKCTTAARRGNGAYMAIVDRLAGGDQMVINHAGLDARPDRARLALGAPGKLTSKPGKRSAEAILRWDLAPGASAYALEVNFTPANPGAWVALAPGRSRRRIIKAPAPAAQFLVRVASIGGTAVSDWTDAILATAL